MKSIILNFLFFMGILAIPLTLVIIFILFLYVGSEYQNPDLGVFLIFIRKELFWAPALLILLLLGFTKEVSGGPIIRRYRMMESKPLNRGKWEVIVKGEITSKNKQL